MKIASFPFEVLTPAIAGAALPKKRAEIRPASIRGQLRWWFRVLGGFKTQNAPVRQQEHTIFGSITKGNIQASRLVVRVKNAPVSVQSRTMQDLDAQPDSDKGYLLWPLRRQEDARAVIEAGSRFELQILWKGDAALWPGIHALISIFAHLGSLGFRGRRAMGALTASSVPALPDALAHFASPDAITIRSLDASGGSDAISQLGGWLKSWRTYGRTHQNSEAQKMPGFTWARSDHDLAASILFKKSPPAGPLHRAALGMPLTQRFGNEKLDWAPVHPNHPEPGRFASPVLLRPHRTPSGAWKALVIFIHPHEWPEGKPVYAKRATVPVSRELLDAMQSDPRLHPFPGTTHG